MLYPATYRFTPQSDTPTVTHAVPKPPPDPDLPPPIEDPMPPEPPIEEPEPDPTIPVAAL